MAPPRILVIKLSALGDMILAFPAFARMRVAHPDARITLLTTPPFGDLARRSPYFDKVETDGRPEGMGGWLKLVTRLRSARYQRVYDLQANDRTGLIFQALRPFPPAWSGTAAGCALPHRNPDRSTMHSLERHGDQLRNAGIWPDAPVTPLSAPPPDVGWMLTTAATVPAAIPKALLVPGAAAHRPEKRWPAALYGDLAAQLIAKGYEVDIIGSAQERNLAATIQARAPAARDLTGATDLFQIAALGASAALAVGNDTGPMHLIAAAGATCVSLFSAASNPALSAPRGAVTVLRSADFGDLSVEEVMAKCLPNATPMARNVGDPPREALDR